MPGVPKTKRIADPACVEQVRKRDGICLIGLTRRDGCAGGLDVHHIRTRGSGGDDVLTNLIYLCRKHHSMAHTGQISKDELRQALHDHYGYEVAE